METTSKQKESLDVLSKKGTCVEFFSAYQDMDIDRMLALCTPSGVVAFEPLGDAGKGKITETGKGIWSALMQAFPDLDNTVIEQAYDNNSNSVACKVRIFGRQQHEFAGLASKGLRFDSDHIFIFRFNEEGKITAISISWDHASFVSQLQG